MMNRTRLTAVMIFSLIMMSGIAAGQDLLMVDVYKDGNDVMITGTSTTEGYPPRNPSDSGDYLVRVADFENKTIQSRYFDLENTTDGHAPPAEDRNTVSHTIVFPYDNQTSHVVLYDETMQRVESHTVQEQPPSQQDEGTGSTPDGGGVPLFWYMIGGILALGVGIVLYLSLDFK